MAERRKEKRRPWPGDAGGANVRHDHVAGARPDKTGPDTDAARRGRPGKGGSPRSFHRYPALRAAVRPYVLGLVTALVLTLAFPPAEISWLAYVALVPLLVMAVRTPSGRAVFLAAGLAGLVFFSLNMYWIQPITWAGYVALMPYLALYWAVFAWGVRRINLATGLPLTVLAPVVWVPLEFIRAWLLTGLPWLFIGHTQYENLALIQIADMFGAYGVSFLVLMTAGLAADLLTRPLYVPAAEARPDETGRGTQAVAAAHRLSRVMLLMVVLALAAWALTLGYGFWRLGQPATRPGPVVASVQTCVPQDIKVQARIRQIEEFEERMVCDQMDLTAAARDQARREGLKIDLVVWPETMVPGIQNREFLEADLAARLKDADLVEVFGYLQQRSRIYWKQIRETARAAGAPVLFGAHAVLIEGAYALPGGGYLTRGPRHNAALLVGPESEPYAAEHLYAKSHLVPFGEFLPFRESWPWLHERLLDFTPYQYEYSLTPGAPDQAPFVLPWAGGEARFQAPICYEDAMPSRIREMVRSDDPARPKAVDFLVNISNDGWFNGSIELDQHLNLCVFRAVENRVPIVRSVNTGISALIDPLGRIQKVVEKDGRRRWVTGQIVGPLTLDRRVAFYTRAGDVLALGCLAEAVALGAATAVLTWLRKRKEAGP